MKSHAAVALTISLAVATLPGRAPAQALAPAAPDTACTYRRCALWVEGRWLVRGASGERVARSGVFVAMPVREHVAGDSAIHYALRFQRADGRARSLGWGGAVSFAIGLAMDQVRDRHCGVPFPFGQCRDRDGTTLVALGLITAGLVSYHVSIPYAIKAQRSRTRAIWWHNLAFAR